MKLPHFKNSARGPFASLDGLYHLALFFEILRKVNAILLKFSN